MFIVDLSYLIGIIILLWVLFFYILWMFCEQPLKYSRFSMDKKVIRRCSICTYTYFLSSDVSISRCPQCKSLNKA